MGESKRMRLGSGERDYRLPLILPFAPAASGSAVVQTSLLMSAPQPSENVFSFAPAFFGFD